MAALELVKKKQWFSGAESFDLCTIFMFKTPMTFTAVGKCDHHRSEAAAAKRTFDISESCRGALEQGAEPPKAQAPLKRLSVTNRMWSLFINPTRVWFVTNWGSKQDFLCGTN